MFNLGELFGTFLKGIATVLELTGEFTMNLLRIYGVLCVILFAIAIFMYIAMVIIKEYSRKHNTVIYTKILNFEEKCVLKQKNEQEEIIQHFTSVKKALRKS